jgi:sigma-B regulation protein RsbU (phosphoserine phosphatase)
MDAPVPPAGGDFEDFFENTLNGYVMSLPDGRIARANRRMADWLGYASADVAGRPFSDFLTIGGKIYYETHLAPLLRMQGWFDEVAIELKARDGTRVPVFVNALERQDSDGRTVSIRLTVFKASDRRRYEEYLRQARRAAETILDDERETARLREQFIAVLGHDLRNPLSAIASGADMLLRLSIEDRTVAIAKLIQGSAMRMGAMIDDVMDFARGRLGGGIAVTRRRVDLAPVLEHVVDELRTAHPSRNIEAAFALTGDVVCDPGRLSQLLSNLLANAITHGSAEAPIRVFAEISGGHFTLSVANAGRPIPPEDMGRLFKPFERGDARTGRDGLGLGLYIASEIARAHGGALRAVSSGKETRFTLTMPQDESKVLETDERTAG